MAPETHGQEPNGFQLYYRGTGRRAAARFSGCYLLAWALSALQWKRLHPGRLTLYTDPPLADFLARAGLTGLWDAVEDRQLDRDIDEARFDCGNFFALGKFFALMHEKAPCCSVDTDLILWRPVDAFLAGKAAVFTHWETAGPRSRWYPAPAELRVPAGYRFPRGWNLNMPAANTSFLYFGDDRLKERYAGEALRFARDNFMERGPGTSAEALFAEQRLMTACLRGEGAWMRSAPLLDAVWDADRGCFVSHDPRNGPWDFYGLNNPLLTHVWIAKGAIEDNEKFRGYYGCRLLELVRRSDAATAAALERLETVKPYARLLERDTARGLLGRGIISDRLYM